MAVEDVTALLGKERGTAFDHDSVMFAHYDDGAIFNYDAKFMRDYDEMLTRDGKANTIEQVLTLPIRQAPHSIQRDESDEEVHATISRILLGEANNGGMTTPMNLIIAQMCGAIVYKKAFFEKVWTEKEIEGKSRVAYQKLAWRPASTCQIVRDPKTGAFQGFKQQPITEEQSRKGEDILFKPMSAFVYIHGKHRNPLEGVSSLDVAYWCYQTKQKIRFLWYSFLEGQSLPKTIVKHASQQEADKAAKKLVGLRQGGVVGMTDKHTIDPFESSGRGAAQFVEALRWLDSESSGSVLAGFTDLGSQAAGGTGSFALSKDQTDFFLMSRQADSREMQDDINQFVIPDLVRWNFGPKAKSPKFEFGPIAEDDANMAIQLLQSTAPSWNPDNSAIPRGFMDELIERVAGFLELNTQVVRKGLEDAAAKAERRATLTSSAPNAGPVAAVAGAVDKAAEMVKEKQERDNTDRDLVATGPQG